MPLNLNDLLDIDDDDPKIISARNDREQYLELMKSLGSLRRAHGKTQAEVAAAMETTQSVVSELEQAGSDPRFSTVQRYARAVGAKLHVWHAVEGGRPVQSFAVRATSGADAFFERSAIG